MRTAELLQRSPILANSQGALVHLRTSGICGLVGPSIVIFPRSVPHPTRCLSQLPRSRASCFQSTPLTFFVPRLSQRPRLPPLSIPLLGIPGTLTLLPFAFAGPAQRCGALHCTDVSLTLPCGLVILCHFWLLLCSACAVPHVTYRVVYGAVNWAGMTAPLLSSPVLSVPWLVRPPCSSVLSLPAHYPLPCTLRYAVLGTGLTDSDYSDALLLTTYLPTYILSMPAVGRVFVGQSLG